MKHYIKKYPLSLSFIAIVVYLSLFRPPQTDIFIPLFVHTDKLVHFLMYAGISVTLWFEFFRGNKLYKPSPIWHAWIGAFVCPILFGGAIELAQTYCTTFRSGDWYDLLANILGVCTATALALRLFPRLFRRKEA